ncbi:MAG: hypothetical protein IT500_16770, partial [Rubrivivax sp.]|nr:hypothetical protein [Rubrivivax sp.]
MKHALPTRELALAAYPQREEDAHAAFAHALRRLRARLAGLGAARLPPALARTLQAECAALARHDAPTLGARAAQLRAPLRQAGLGGPQAAQALALVATLARHTLGHTPYPTQLGASWAMLQGRFVERATGEGKTLATGMAAAVAALAGVPVQVLTANDYLVQRDRDALAPLHEALGLQSACVLPATPRPERARAYRGDVVYLSARELAFDYLKDHLASRGERDARVLAARALQGAEGRLEGDREGDREGPAPKAGEPVLPGLFVTLVDEADSVLL